MNGLVGLVTGAASGLGRATVARLSSRVKGIIAIDRQKYPEAIKQLANVEALTRCDFTKEEDVSRALEICREKFGRLDFCVNCAGASISYTTYNALKQHCHSMESFQEVLTLNVAGAFNVTRLAVALMKEKEANENGLRGVIINTSSISAFGGLDGQSALSACSGAINSMTLPLARDLGSHGIRSNTISVGHIETPLFSHLPGEVKDFFGRLACGPKRMGKAEEFAQLVETIIDNPYINGSVIKLDAGTHLPALQDF